MCLANAINNLFKQSETIPSMIKITFLGTSGAVPSPKRNHPSIFISYGSEGFLFDCGEGTQTQFKKAKISPTKVTKLFITHWHGDHVLGMPGLLQTLSFNNYNKTLEIYGPKGIRNNFENVLRAFPSITVSDMRDNIGVRVYEINGKFIDKENWSIEAFPVSHGIASNGYCFIEKDKIRVDKKKLKKFKIKEGPHLSSLKQGKDIIYEGKKYKVKDLTYSEKGKKICIIMDGIDEPSLIRYAKDSDILIMESTYGEDLEKLAKEHKHRTSKQCAEFAKKAKVKKLILTHLSERYDKTQEEILKQTKKIFKNSFIPNDLESFEI